MFKILKKSSKSDTRLTELKTSHGTIRGPFFMPIATRAAVKNLTTDELKSLGAQIVLANTYHLLIAPGPSLIKKIKGLHKFMNWPSPILTDSGGFQVFSLASHRQVTEKGVTFRDPQNGNKYFLTPEKSIGIQRDLGVDIAMVLDDVIGYPTKKADAQEAMERTTRWARRCKSQKQGIKKTKKQLLFGIVQGGVYRDLRIESAKEIVKIGFDGYAVGGVAVGEPREKMKDILNWVVPLLPENKPRYLMGLGRPEEIVRAVKQGIDMFDCVIPTREARHGRLYLWANRQSPIANRRNDKRLAISDKPFYHTININNAKFKNDLSPINNTSLKQYSKAYLHHLFRTNEPLGMRLATLNNLNFYFTLMQQIRNSIKKGIL